MVYETNSAKETFALGERLGREAVAGSVLCLDGDLGVGKTVFTQGFAHGLGVSDYVNSPTFTIVKEYEGRLPLYHFDMYRLGEESELLEIGYEDYFYGKGVCVIEWPERAAGLIPEEADWLRITKEPEKGFDYRRIELLERGETGAAREERS